MGTLHVELRQTPIRNEIHWIVRRRCERRLGAQCQIGSNCRRCARPSDQVSRLGCCAEGRANIRMTTATRAAHKPLNFVPQIVAESQQILERSRRCAAMQSNGSRWGARPETAQVLGRSPPHSDTASPSVAKMLVWNGVQRWRRRRRRRRRIGRRRGRRRGTTTWANERK